VQKRHWTGKFQLDTSQNCCKVKDKGTRRLLNVDIRGNGLVYSSLLSADVDVAAFSTPSGHFLGTRFLDGTKDVVVE